MAQRFSQEVDDAFQGQPATDLPAGQVNSESALTSPQASLQKEKKRGRIATITRHLLRFWWAYFLLIVVVTLAIVLPIIYVYYPNKARSEINNARIVSIYQSISDPTPTTFFYNQSSVIETDSSYDPQLFSWNGAYYLENSTVPFLSVTIPQAQASNGTEIRIQQEVKIADMSELIKNNDLLFTAKNFSIYLRGDGSIKQGGLPTVSVYYDKQIDLQGLNGLQGIQVSEFHILTTPLYDGANAAGNVSILNPSIFTLQMGNVTLDLSVNGTSIGNATLPNFTLTPGTHQYLLHVTANQSQVLDLIKKPAYRCGKLPIEIQGKMSIFNGQEIPYFSAPLQGSVLRTKLDLAPALQEIGFGSVINGTCV